MVPHLRSIFSGPICATLVLLCAGCGDDGSDSENENPTPAKTQIEILHGELNISGNHFAFPCSIDDVVKALGKPTREHSLRLENSDQEKQKSPTSRPVRPMKVYVWDEHGVSCFVEMKTNRVITLNVLLHKIKDIIGEVDYQHTRPKNVFSGSLRFEGLIVTKETSPESMNDHLAVIGFAKTFQSTKTFARHSWKLDYHGVAARLLTGSGGAMIVEFSLEK